MMTEERTRFEVLLENIDTKVNVIAEGHAGLHQRLDQMEARFDVRFDRLETQVNVLAVKVNGLEVKVDGLEVKVDGLEVKVDGLETKVDGLEVFAADAQRRLERIETHLQLKGSTRPRARHKAAPRAAPERRKKS
jgi:outer membrane murein-binding lipoprotein Lpp